MRPTASTRPRRNAVTTVDDRVLPHPLAPATLADAGVSLDMVLQIALKTLHFAGDLTGSALAARLGVQFSVIEPALDLLKAEHHVEIAGGSFVGPSAYKYRITDAGRVRAALFFRQNQYLGVVPVPLAQYQQYMIQYAKVAPRSATRARVREAFSHLVLSDRVLDQLGPAVNAGHSLFVYGPPGNGKTVISQAIRTLLDGDLAIPHALDIEGSIVRLFDPVVHEELPQGPDQNGSGLDLGAQQDARWVRCRRPLVMVGGELTVEQLDLAYNPMSQVYKAPIQAVANGGVLVLDDFGRQQSAPQVLLNRWMVPLESRVDFLTLQSGQKFDLPFAVLVVFATNIRPEQLVDEAFLRRIQYKVLAESPSVEQFTTIFRNYCVQAGIDYDPALVKHVVHYCRSRGIALRGCQPRDLIEQSLSLADYLGEPRRLTTELLDGACASYFVDDRESAAVQG